MTSASIFGALRKVEPQADGSLRIEGIASSENADSAGEIILASAMKAAIPGFMFEGRGALREQHLVTKAAGTVDEIEVDEETGQTRVVCTVVDSETVKKVLTKTLRGLSVGGRVVSRDKRNPKIITEIDWQELSLCDRPCNKACSITMAKAQTAVPLGQQPVEGGGGQMNPVQHISPDQVRAYLAGLGNEERATFLVSVLMRSGLGRRKY